MNGDYQTVTIKSVMTGLAACYLANELGYGRYALQVGTLMAGANVLCFAKTKRLNRTSWINPPSWLQSWTAIRDNVRSVAMHNVIITGLLLLLAMGGARATVGHARWAVQRDLAMEIGKICIVSPIAEEIFYRGFLQEKIEETQLFLRTGAGDPNAERDFRILLQAIAFGLSHYRPYRMPLDNCFHMFAIGLSGYMLGRLKEGHGIHSCMLLHSAFNSLSVLRILLVRG
jgi:membrane protease YdiL (CAAX protease family)